MTPTAARAPDAAPPPVQRALRRSARSVMLVLAAAHVVLALLVFDPAPHTGGDNAVYVTLARSLLHEQAYLNLYDPATPPHTQYPPVFPLILATVMAVGVGGWLGWKLVIVAISGAAVALSWLWLSRRTHPAIALGAAILLAIAPGVVHLSHWVLSDVPFWAFTMLALWAFERRPASVDGRFLAGTAATVLAYFTRSAGLPLVIAVAAWLLLRRRWRQLAVFAAVFLPLALLWWLRARASGGVDYVSQFWMVDPYDPAAGRAGVMDLLDRVIANDQRYLSTHLPVLLTGLSGVLLFPLGIAVSVLAVFGWARRLRRPGVAELFVPLYVGLVFLWPAVWSGERFLLPVLPAILAYGAEALVRAVRRLRSLRAGFRAALAAAALIAMLALPVLALGVADGLACNRAYARGDRYACLPPEWREFYGMAELSGSILPDGAVILSRKPATYYVLSGRRGRNYPLTREPDDFFAYAREAGARYVVLDHVDQLSALYLGPVLLRRPQAFCSVYIAEGGAGILGIHELAAGIPDVPDAPGVGDYGLNVPDCPPDFDGAAPGLPPVRGQS